MSRQHRRQPGAHRSGILSSLPFRLQRPDGRPLHGRRHGLSRGKTWSKNWQTAAARMGDLRITATDLNREKPRLLDEVSNMFGRIPALAAVNVARELIRPAPRGGRKGGLPEHVQAITLDDVRTYWTRYYKPRNAILVLAGAVDEAAARHAVAAHFAESSPGKVLPNRPSPACPDQGPCMSWPADRFNPRPRPWPAWPMPLPSQRVRFIPRSWCW